MFSNGGAAPGSNEGSALTGDGAECSTLLPGFWPRLRASHFWRKASSRRPGEGAWLSIDCLRCINPTPSDSCHRSYSSARQMQSAS